MVTKRNFCGDMVSLLGFGTMRFPQTPEGVIDREKSSEMLRFAIDNGVNYFDTARPYHNGESEKFMGDFLSQYDRRSYYVATKLPFWSLQSAEQAVEIFNDQLKNLKTDYIDFYLFHSLDKTKFEKLKNLGLTKIFEKFKAEGKIRHLGFSFHDDYEVFQDILNYRDWDFCQIQINYMDTDYQAGLKGIELCDKKGIPMIAMEPVRGGSLARFDKDITDIFARYDNRSLAAWALGWVGSISAMKTVLSGMSTLEQVRDNIKTFTDFTSFNDKELETVSDAVTVIRSRRFNACTKCRYCMPCPAGVEIPENFSIANNGKMYNNTEGMIKRLSSLEGKASLCIGCGKCEKLCPQHIRIREDLNKLKEFTETR